MRYLKWQRVWFVEREGTWPKWPLKAPSLLQPPLRLSAPRLASAGSHRLSCGIPDIATSGALQLSSFGLFTPLYWWSIWFSDNLPKKKLPFCYFLPFFHKSWFCNALLKIHLKETQNLLLAPPPSCSIKFLLHWAMTNMYSMLAMKIVFPFKCPNSRLSLLWL